MSRFHPENRYAKRSWFSISNKPEEKETHIAIMDEIGGWGISAADFKAALADVDKENRIKLHIHSPGGSVFDGNEIYNALKAHPGGVDVTLGAICASIATVIACAGETVSMPKNGLYMIHNVSAGVYGDAKELRQKADVMDKLQNGIVDCYKAFTDEKEKDIREMMDEETWMSAEEAKEKGFVSEVIDDEEGDDDEMEDRFHLENFRNYAPAMARLGRQRPEKKKEEKTSSDQPNNQFLRDYESGRISIFAT